MNTFYRLATSSTIFLLLSSPAAMHAQYAPQQAPPPGYGDHGGWDNVPSEFTDAQRRGFHDGIEGARKDYENHRAPNVNNRDEYRHPSVPGRDRRAYRDAFRRGYSVGVQHLMNGNMRR